MVVRMRVSSEGSDVVSTLAPPVSKTSNIATRTLKRHKKGWNPPPDIILTFNVVLQVYNVAHRMCFLVIASTAAEILGS